jgi:hypothetical protein
VTKRYDEPIDVTSDPSVGPLSFCWRGRTYRVDERLDSWREAGEMWDARSARDREYHRVLARPAGALASGDVDPDGFLCQVGAVYEVYLDRIRKVWRIARVWD